MSKFTIDAIDDAIKHATDVARRKYVEGMLYHANSDDGELDDCIKCGREHEQLAEWLEELKCYKDLEDQLEKLYGDRLSLDKVVENLNRVVQNGEEKLDYARILTNAEAEKWDRWKSLEDQGRLVEQRYATTCECCCSACKEDYTRVAEGESGMVWEGEYPNYCPWCGAKFVSEEELKEIEGTE